MFGKDKTRKLKISAGSAVGGRKDNQDNLLLDNVIKEIEFLRKDICLEGTLSIEKERRIFVVCDGMGGREDGQIASKMAIEFFQKNLAKLKSGSYTPVDVTKLILEINMKIASHFKEKSKKSGTTLSLVCVNPDSTLEVYNIGDSPVWLIRDGKMYLISEEQSLAGLKLKRGVITEVEYEKSNEKSILMGNLGDESNKAVLGLYYNKIDLMKNDIVLVASDGLAGALGKERLHKMIVHGDSAENILSVAKKVPDTDNITMIMLTAI